MADWQPVPLDAKMFQNVDETALKRAHATLENGFVTEAKGFSRWPGLEDFAELPSEGRIYVKKFKNDLIAVTQTGRLFRVDQNGETTNLTDATLAGGLRPTFAETEDKLAIAAGGPILGFDGATTFELSGDAPISTHVGQIDGFLVANERDSGRFLYSEPGDIRKWNPLDVLAAGGSPDNVTALIVTPFRELLVCGPDSVEQYERLASGDPPFFRRWSVAEGIEHPYTLTFADNAAWGVNGEDELVRFSGQISRSTSDDIGRTMKGVTNWDDAWSDHLSVKGQKFIVLQIPKTLNPYGTEGATLLFDYRTSRWSSLYAWDTDAAVPVHYPVWSYASIWRQTFIGGENKIYRVTEADHWLAGQPMRLLLRTAHYSDAGETRIDNLRLRVKRGVGTYTVEQKIRIRCNRDNKGFTPWSAKSLGRSGDREMHIEFGGFGCAKAWQFEIEVSDNCAVEIAGLDVQSTKIGR